MKTSQSMLSSIFALLLVTFTIVANATSTSVQKIDTGRAIAQEMYQIQVELANSQIDVERYKPSSYYFLSLAVLTEAQVDLERYILLCEKALELAGQPDAVIIGQEFIANSLRQANLILVEVKFEIKNLTDPTPRASIPNGNYNNFWVEYHRSYSYLRNTTEVFSIVIDPLNTADMPKIKNLSPDEKNRLVAIMNKRLESYDIIIEGRRLLGHQQDMEAHKSERATFVNSLNAVISAIP